MDQYKYIRTAYRVYVKKIKQIARQTGHSKNTIKTVLKTEYVGYHSRQKQSYPVLGPYIKSIDKWLANDKDSPKKQRDTGTRIYNRLKHEQNYQGPLSTVLHYVQVAIYITYLDYS